MAADPLQIDPLGFKVPRHQTVSWLAFHSAYSDTSLRRIAKWDSMPHTPGALSRSLTPSLSPSLSPASRVSASAASAASAVSAAHAAVARASTSSTTSTTTRASTSSVQSLPSLHPAGLAAGRRPPPPRSDKVKRLVRKGIPMSMRPQCWFRYSGAEALSLQEPGLYTMLCFREAQDVRHGYDKTTNPILEFVEVIDRDLYRTFPNNERFVARQTPARQPQPPIVSRSASQHSQPDTQCMPSRESHAQQPQDDSDKQSQSDMLSDYLDRRRGSSASAFMASAAAAAASLGMRLFEGLSSNTSLGSNTSSRASDASGSSSGSSSSTSAGSDAPDARTSTSSADSDGISSFSSDGSASSCSSVASSSSSSPVGSAPQSPQRACPAPANGRSEFSLAGAGHIFSAERCAGSDVDNADARASTLPRESIGLPSIALECNPYLLALRRVLVCFAYYSWPHPDESRAPSRTCSYNVGYCQSLNFIVGLLLLVFVDADPSLRTAFESDDQDARMDVETRVFWMLVAIVECLLPPETYGNTLEGSQIQQEILWSWILRKKGAKFGLEACSKWLDQLSSDSPDARRAAYARQTDSSMGDLEMLVQTAASRAPVLSMVTTPWFMALFVNTMPTETVLRIWDCFFYQGEKILFRVVLTLLSMHEDKLIVCSDFSDAWNMLRDLPKDTIDCEEFMKNCFKPRVVINPFGSGSRPSSPRLTRFPHGVPSSPLSLSPATPVEEAVSQARAQSSAPVVSVTMPPPQPALPAQQPPRSDSPLLDFFFSRTSFRSPARHEQSMPRASAPLLSSPTPLSPSRDHVQHVQPLHPPHLAYAHPSKHGASTSDAKSGRMSPLPNRAPSPSPNGSTTSRDSRPIMSVASPTASHGHAFTLSLGGVNQKMIEKYRSLVMEQRHHHRQLQQRQRLALKQRQEAEASSERGSFEQDKPHHHGHHHHGHHHHHHHHHHHYHGNSQAQANPT